MKLGYRGEHESKKNNYLKSRTVRALLCIPFLTIMAASSKLVNLSAAEYTGACVVEKANSHVADDSFIFMDENIEEEINDEQNTEGETAEKDNTQEKTVVEENVSSNHYSRAKKVLLLEDPLDIVEEIIPKVSVVYPIEQIKLLSKQVEEASHELTKEEKLSIIEEIHDIDEFEFYQLVSTTAHEGGEENYEECYDVVCVAYNRTLSKAWCWSCKQSTGNDGTNIMDQIRWIGQFSGFLPKEAGYDQEKYEGTEAERAVLDFLYTLERSNDYLCFCAPWYEGRPSSAVQLHPEIKGNAYYRLLKEDDYNDKAIEEEIKVLEKTHMH